MSRVFISYRRDDSSGHALLLYKSLVGELGADRVFMDLDTIEAGRDFVDVIEEALETTDVVLAVIGRRWLAVTDRRRHRRLDNPDDYLRLEIARSLSRPDVRV